MQDEKDVCLMCKTVLQIRDPVLFDPWNRDPGGGKIPHPNPGSGMNI
jgi:hypothetical protein